MPTQFELLTTLVCFGALVGFLHAARIGDRPLRVAAEEQTLGLVHLVVPLVGRAITVYVLINMAHNALIAGFIWLALGAIGAWCVQRLGRAQRR